MAATAVSAGTFLKILVSRNAAQFECLGHQFVDAFLHFVHFLLRIDEGLGDGIAEKGVTFGLESGDFTAPDVASRGVIGLSR
jgi:hypothetical protein